LKNFNFGKAKGTAVYFKWLQALGGSFTIGQGHMEFTEISMPVLEIIGGNIMVENSPSLELINLPQLVVDAFSGTCDITDVSAELQIIPDEISNVCTEQDF